MIVKAAGRILGKLLVILLAGVSVNIAQAAEPEGIPPELVAEYIHAVIQADRNIYSTHVVEQLQDRKIAVAAEDWKEKRGGASSSSIASDGRSRGSGARPRSPCPPIAA